MFLPIRRGYSELNIELAPGVKKHSEKTYAIQSEELLLTLSVISISQPGCRRGVSPCTFTQRKQGKSVRMKNSFFLAPAVLAKLSPYRQFSDSMGKTIKRPHEGSKDTEHLQVDPYSCRVE